MSILVVEDIPAIREMLLDVLEGAGYTAVGVGNGQEALDYLHQHNCSAQDDASVCLIVLDLMMPGMNGWTFRSRQMAQPKCSDIPVVVISEVAELPKHAAVLRAVEYLPKPIHIGSLLAVVWKHCRKVKPLPHLSPRYERRVYS